MNRIFLRFSLGLALGTTSARPAENAVPEGPTIELPPMIVAESVKSPPWHYVSVGGTEYLSRCSPGLTREFITAQLEARQLLRILAPDTIWTATDIPVISVVVPLDQKRAGDDAVREEILRLERAASEQTLQRHRETQVIPTGASQVYFAPNLRLDDRDLSVAFTYLEERGFNARQLITADDYVQYLMVRRTPLLPAWLTEGLVAVYRDAELKQHPVTLPPLTWLSRAESIALQRDPDAPRVLLPAAELFAPDAVVGEANRHPERIAVWRAEVALFFRWVLDPAQRHAREALWRLVDRATRGPITETDFVACFGFGYTDLRDRLSDYLPTAVREPLRLEVPPRPPPPRFELKPATPAQVARLRGEWERLQVPYVRRRHPSVLPRYVSQARITLEAAYARGDRDPRLLATLGLLELDAQNLAGARPHLEAASAAGVERPRVHYEVARLRWEDLTRVLPGQAALRAATLEPVLEPLRRALRQRVVLPEAVALLAEVWLQSSEPPPPADFELLEATAPLFVRIPTIGYRVARLQARHGRLAEARALFTASQAFVVDPAVRRHFDQLQPALAAPTAP